MGNVFSFVLGQDVRLTNLTERRGMNYFFSRGLLEEDYVSLIWTTFAEFPGTILAMMLINCMGRKKTMAIQVKFHFFFVIS